MTKRRVVVTGLGMVSPVGLTVKSTWEALLQGRSGVSLITEFDTSTYSVKIAATVKNFDPLLYFSAKDVRRFDTFIQYGVAAAAQAVEDAGLMQLDENKKQRVGVALGSGIGGLPMIEKNVISCHEDGPRKISPFFIPGSIINMCSGVIAINYGFQGPNFAMATACATGAHCIGYAARTIAYGDAEVMVAGGAEKASTSSGIGGFASMRALSTRNDAPEKASRPWDKDRDGFVLGDGAGVIVLEEYEHAKKRGAHIYAELTGFGMSDDAFHITQLHEEGLGSALAINNALKDASIEVKNIGYVNAHGTSTPLGDPIEIKAIKAAFGEHAKSVAVSSTKSMTGHLLGAAGSVEAIISILALRDNIIPPTINLENPDEGCDLNLVPHKPQEKKLNYVLSNSFGFGGTNACLIFGRI